MKKIFTLCTALLMTASVLFAQTGKHPFCEKQLPAKPARGINVIAKQAKNGAKVSGNPTWGDTMSYCQNDAFASAVGVGSAGTDVYWAIKIESAALANRTYITDVEFYVYKAGSYTMSIAYGSTSPGTAVLTQSVTATSSDVQTWKNIHLNPALTITANQDMWIILMNNDADYPASGVTGNTYDNGKYISLGGTSWDLVTTYNLDYTWMIRAISSNTYTPEVPSVSISGPTTVMAGDTVTYTATTGADSYAWTFAGADYQSTNSNTASVMWLTAGTKQVVVGATNTVGTGYDTINVNVISCDPITTLPWLEDFEGATLCWQIVDNDNDGTTWGIDNVGSYAYEGAKALYCSYSSTQSDDWAISPAITIPANATDMNLSWYVRARSTTYPETYEVYVSDNGTALTSFDSVFGEEYGQTTYAKRTVSLANYAGQTINIAFRYRSTDMYNIFIDNVRVGGSELPESVVLDGPVEVQAGATATFTASAVGAESFSWTFEDGNPATATGETATTTWTTTGNKMVILAATNSVGSVYDTVMVNVFECNTITDLPYTVDFSTMNTLGCWTAIDANNDQFTWSILSTYGAVNFSYDNASASPITPNDYLVSPAITIPATGNYEMHFTVYGLDQSYVAEHYSVYIATGNTVADFSTAVLSETLTTGLIEHTISLNNYSGQTIYVAFRHHDCNDMFGLTLQDFEIRGLSAPTVEIQAPAGAIAGTTVTLSAVGDNIDSYSWNIPGATPSTATTQSVDVVWNNAGTYTITLTATNAAGSSNATATINVFSCNPITSFPYTFDFEDETGYECYTIIDADGDGYVWMPGFMFDEPQAHNNSNGMMVSQSYINNLGALEPDNWIFLPAVEVPANGTLALSWWEKGQDASYAEEHYAVYVNSQPTTSTTNKVYEGDATGEWIQRNVSLANYAGQTVYIGFRHFNVTDMFMLDIDDIVLSLGGNNGINGTDANAISVYPNPTTGVIFVEGEGINTVDILDVNGRIVSSSNAGSIDISELSNGVYMVRIATENGITVKKIVKK